jgi:hypothetical protein
MAQISRAVLIGSGFFVGTNIWLSFYGGPDGGANAQAKARRFHVSGLPTLFGLPPR